MHFRLLHDEASGAMSYLLADLDAGEAVLIDPRGGRQYGAADARREGTVIGLPR